MTSGRRSVWHGILCLGLLATLILCLAAPATATKGGPSLQINKRGYLPGEKIIVRFTAPASWPTNAWVGIIPARVPHGSEAVNDRFDVAYQYLRRRTEGTLIFRAPTTPGAWTMRMHDTDANGREVASVTFMVQGAAPLRLNKGVYRPGERIIVHFRAEAAWPGNAWVGIIPARVPHGSETVNDRFDVAYQYLRRRTSGVLYFKAPMKPGAWTVRMHDTDAGGRE
ncbi:MAG: hypothetical protein KKC37_11570, partial [Proteobacteria bacterium]|nr:hypothetical protein [Pseudomonadota bacterium]